jgi:hypothetical protein
VVRRPVKTKKKGISAAVAGQGEAGTRIRVIRTCRAGIFSGVSGFFPNFIEHRGDFPAEAAHLMRRDATRCALCLTFAMTRILALILLRVGDSRARADAKMRRPTHRAPVGPILDWRPQRLLCVAPGSREMPEVNGEENARDKGGE